MSNIEHINKTPTLRESVTTISANARIDYILRFSKHAVLVIDDDSEVYTNVGNEFLGSLSKDHNAAFVSISSKLNDIQIRCRIIEQLFGNTLFDPEQPLSVNVVKLAEAKNEAITIVISNVEYLSLQLSHELCQLAEIAKKLNKTINVLLLGKIQAAINLSENKHLFDNKISILLAENGQLISWNSSILKNKKSGALVKNLLIIFALLIVLCGLAFVYISGGFSTTNSVKQENTIPKEEYKKVFVQANKTTHTNLQEDKQIEVPIIATSAEVFKFLIAEENTTKKELTASIADIRSNEPITKDKVVTKLENEVSLNNKNTGSFESKPLPVSELAGMPDKIEVAKAQEVKVVDAQTISLESEQLDISNNADYYQSYIEGYVIQLASFNKVEGYKSFLNTHKNNPFHGYTRELNGKVTHIVTSHVYKSIPQAKQAISVLSQELRDRGPWIKSVQAVNNEINLYNQSQ